MNISIIVIYSIPHSIDAINIVSFQMKKNNTQNYIFILQSNAMSSRLFQCQFGWLFFPNARSVFFCVRFLVFIFACWMCTQSDEWSGAVEKKKYEKEKINLRNEKKAKTTTTTLQQCAKEEKKKRAWGKKKGTNKRKWKWVGIKKMSDELMAHEKCTF